jgi:hypothetical protein
MSILLIGQETNFFKTAGGCSLIRHPRIAEGGEAVGIFPSKREAR